MSDFISMRGEEGVISSAKLSSLNMRKQLCFSLTTSHINKRDMPALQSESSSDCSPLKPFCQESAFWLMISNGPGHKNKQANSGEKNQHNCLIYLHSIRVK